MLSGDANAIAALALAGMLQQARTREGGRQGGREGLRQADLTRRSESSRTMEQTSVREGGEGKGREGGEGGE